MSGRILSSIIPVLLGLVGVAAANFPISFFGGHVPAPMLGFMPLYFWAVVRPDLMSPFWVFVLGLTEDLLSGGPPGLWAASFLAAYFVIDRQRDVLAGLSGIGAILGFAVATLVACMTATVIVGVYYWHLPPLAPVMGTLAATVIVYVVAAFVLGGIHRRLVGPLRSDF